VTSFTIPIPTYQCHKRVQALKIKLVVANPRGYELHFDGDRFVPMQFDDAWEAKHKPLPGMYVVWYEDGYVSCSPAAAFEAGYTLVGAGPSQSELDALLYPFGIDPCEVKVGPATQAAREVFQPQDISDLIDAHPIGRPRAARGVGK
jgi:hypothetical protein